MKGTQFEVNLRYCAHGTCRYDDSDASSFLSSVLSEVRRGVEIEGRLYPSYGKHEYGMPIDKKELDR